MVSSEFNYLYSIYYKRMHYIAYRYTNDSFLAEDIVQESFFKVYKKLDTIDDSGKLGAWLAAITARTAIDFLRMEKRRNLLLVDASDLEPMVQSEVSGTNPEEAAEIQLALEEISGSMSFLSEEFQQVLILKACCGLKDNEIAEFLSLNAATVKTRLYRARRKLKRMVG